MTLCIWSLSLLYMFEVASPFMCRVWITYHYLAACTTFDPKQV
jgi:hypothetical protein